MSQPVSPNTYDAGPQRSDSGFLRLMALVSRRDYLRTVRRRGFLIGTLLLPVGLGLILTISARFSGQATTGPGVTPQTAVVNESQVQLSIGPAMAGSVHVVSRSDADQALSSGQIPEFYVIPAAYPSNPAVTRYEADAATAGQPLEALQRHSQQEDALTVILRDSLLKQAAIPQQVADTILVPATFTAITPDGQPVSQDSAAASFILPYAFTLLFVMSIFITSGYLLQSVTEEKDNRVVEIVLSSIPALPLMAGKILGLGAAGLTQVVIWVITAIVALPLLNAQLSINVQISPVVLVLAILYFGLGYVAYGAIFAAIGAISPGSREAQQYAGFFGFFAVIPLIFTSVFLTDLNSPIVWILALFPLTTPAAMLEILTLSPTLPWGLIVITLITLSIFVVVATLASARVFRATVLLYGVRPGIKQVVGAVLARG
jgi:ABC-2 type transport system permease protein